MPYRTEVVTIPDAQIANLMDFVSALEP
jgi:hypothetical protein